MRIIITFLFILLCSVTTGFESQSKPSLEKCLYPVVMIENNKLSSTGTGFIIKSIKMKEKERYLNFCISCEHILDSGKVSVSTSDYKKPFDFVGFNKHKGIVISKDKEMDMSILCFISETKNKEAMLNMNFDPEVREQVFTIAHGMAEPARYSEGIITSLDSKNNEIKTSVNILFGDSGAPLFYQDKVIGIANAMKAYKFGKLRIPLNNFSIYKNISGCKKLLEDSKLLDFIINNKDADLSEIEKMFDDSK